MERSPKTYYPQLDSVRGFFFLLVFLYHAWKPEITTGFFSQIFHVFYEKIYLSMDVFFVLSSFLLTWLGINEYKKTGFFSFGKYFLRRMLRIWPLYYAVMIFAFVVLLLFAAKAGVAVTLPPPAWYLFFVSNFYSGDHIYFLRFLWSLSVEEQFYMLLGLCLLLFQKYLRAVFTVILLIGIAFNVWGIIHDGNIYFHTLTYFFDFACGAIVAWFIAYSPAFRNFFSSISKRKSPLLYAVFFAASAALFIIESRLTGFTADSLEVITRFGFIIGISILIAEQVLNENTFLKIGKSKFLVYTGKISYGLYCFHGIVLTFGTVFMEKLHISTNILTVLLLFGINYLIAFCSYQFYEKPFLKLKEKFYKSTAN